jgi:hypothetical protein
MTVKRLKRIGKGLLIVGVLGLIFPEVAAKILTRPEAEPAPGAIPGPQSRPRHDLMR